MPKPTPNCAGRHNRRHVGPLGDIHRPLLSHYTLQNCDTRKPREHSLDSHIALAFIAGPIQWTGCYDAKQ